MRNHWRLLQIRFILFIISRNLPITVCRFKSEEISVSTIASGISEKRQQISEEQQERWMKQMVRLSWSMESSQGLVMEF